MNIPNTKNHAPSYEQQLWDTIYLRVLESLMQLLSPMEPKEMCNRAARLADLAMRVRESIPKHSVSAPQPSE